jgi:hypothetical protein
MLNNKTKVHVFRPYSDTPKPVSPENKPKRQALSPGSPIETGRRASRAPAAGLENSPPGQRAARTTPQPIKQALQSPKRAAGMHSPTPASTEPHIFLGEHHRQLDRARQAYDEAVALQGLKATRRRTRAPQDAQVVQRGFVLPGEEQPKSPKATKPKG